MKLLKEMMNLNDEQALALEEVITNIADARVKEALDELLHPVVQIVTPFDVPQYASDLSAGVDIKADLFGLKTKFMDNAEFVDVPKLVDGVKSETETEKAVIIYPGGQFLCPTGIHTAFDGTYEVQIRPRSGLSLKQRVTVTNSPGTIEGDYKDEWGIILANESKDKSVTIRQGDRVAQAVFALVVRPEFEQADNVDDLTGSNRGGGFGHSGV